MVTSDGYLQENQGDCSKVVAYELKEYFCTGHDEKPFFHSNIFPNSSGT